MKKPISLIALLLLLSANLGCSSAATEAQNWRNISNADRVPYYGGLLVKDRYVEIDEIAKTQALKLLAQTEIIELDTKKVALFAKEFRFLDGDWKYFLVRGVRVAGGGFFELYERQGSLLVIHGLLGSTGPDFNTALVVASKVKYSRVFASSAAAR
jgi:hypothetical protein